jgi:hypothetical protein
MNWALAPEVIVEVFRSSEGKHRLNSVRLLGCFALLSIPFSNVCAQKAAPREDVRWCAAIPAFPVLQEATFTAVYGFQTDANGRPTNIRRLSVPSFLEKDRPLIACIASWSLPVGLSEGTASFHFHWGWTGLDVSSGSYKVSILPESTKPVSPAELQ